MRLKILTKKREEGWPEDLPRPYDEGRVIPLKDFLHGQELIDRLERNRASRRRWALDFLGIGGDDD